MNHETDGPNLKVALLWRGDPSAATEKPTPQNNRLYPLFKAFADLNVIAAPVPYTDERVVEIRDRLLECDGVLVWVDPITEDGDRSKLDPMLCEVAERGAFVSARPEVIQKVGTKEVLHRTRHFGWGTDTELYTSAKQFEEEFPARLKSGGPRVLKQRRGNGGIGTWRVELVRRESTRPAPVRVQEARRGSAEEELPLGDFMRRCEKYFADAGCLIDQALQSRTDDGMIRCYLVHDKVVGFSTQMPRAAGNFAMAREKTMYAESEPRFAGLRTKMESDWVPGLRKLFGMETESLPVIWDADFLYGAKDNRGEDTYVLGEINVSAVFPFPDSAVQRIARATLDRMHARTRPD